LFEEFDVAETGPSGPEPSRRLDVVSARSVNYFSDSAYFILGEEPRLDDHLQYTVLATGLLDGLDLTADRIVITRLKPADIDDHVDLISTVLDSLGGLKDFDLGRGVAEGETNHCRDFNVCVNQELLSLFDEAWRDANGREIVSVCLSADLLNVFPFGASL
jgi:hypothetical protein